MVCRTPDGDHEKRGAHLRRERRGDTTRKESIPAQAESKPAQTRPASFALNAHSWKQPTPRSCSQRLAASHAQADPVSAASEGPLLSLSLRSLPGDAACTACSAPLHPEFVAVPEPPVSRPESRHPRPGPPTVSTAALPVRAPSGSDVFRAPVECSARLLLPHLSLWTFLASAHPGLRGPSAAAPTWARQTANKLHQRAAKATNGPPGAEPAVETTVAQQLLLGSRGRLITTIGAYADNWLKTTPRPNWCSACAST